MSFQVTAHLDIMLMYLSRVVEEDNYRVARDKFSGQKGTSYPMPTSALFS